MQRIACDRTLSSYQSLLRVEPLKASCGCPSGVLFTLTFLEMWFVSAPRRVLMRCMARREVVIQLTGHYSTSLSFLSLIDLCQLWGNSNVSSRQSTLKVMCVHSSSKQSLLSKACLFSVNGYVRDKRILKRNDEAGRCLKNLKNKGAIK
jgi:hypothetical protein